MSAKKVERNAEEIKLEQHLNNKSLENYTDLNFSALDDIFLDFSNVKKVEKSFHPTLFAFKKKVEDAGVNLSTINLANNLKQVFVQDGTYSFLNHMETVNRNKPSLIDVTFIQPFIDSAIKVLDIQAQLKATLKGPRLKKPQEKYGDIDIAGVISIVSNAFEGTIAICFPEQTFLKVCEGLFGEPQEEMSEMIEDAAGEVLNMIFGGAKFELNKNKDYGIRSALPSIIRGSNLAITQLKGPTMLLPFETPEGPFFIEIEIVGSE